MIRRISHNFLNSMHFFAVFKRRVRVIAEHLANAIPDPGTVLDLGSGDGSVAFALMQLRADLKIEGVDVMIRPRTHIPVTEYDGITLPFADKSFDYVTIVDVLHHTNNPAAVLIEAARVSRHGIAIKDHLLEGFLAGPTLRVMDWVGNCGYGVTLPYNYLTSSDWNGAFVSAKLSYVSKKERLGLYPPPFSWLFDRKLHSVTFMVPQQL